MSEHTPFLTMFPGCADLRDCCGGLDTACVTDLQIDFAEKIITVSARFSAMPSMSDIALLTERLKRDYAILGAAIIPDYPRQKSATAPAGARRPRARC